MHIFNTILDISLLARPAAHSSSGAAGGAAMRVIVNDGQTSISTTVHSVFFLMLITNDALPVYF